jgi:hypothetical protein
MLAFHAISGRDTIQKFGYRECPEEVTGGLPVSAGRCFV